MLPGARAQAIDVKPGQNDVKNAVIPDNAKPKVDGYIVKMRPDVSSGCTSR